MLMLADVLLQNDGAQVWQSTLFQKFQFSPTLCAEECLPAQNGKKYPQVWNGKNYMEKRNRNKNVYVYSEWDHFIITCNGTFYFFLFV